MAEYESGPYKNFGQEVMKGFAAIVPEDADVAAVGEAVVKIVDGHSGSVRSGSMSTRPRTEPRW